MKKLIAIALILNLNSCFMFRENGIKVEIENNSNEPISNVEFTTSENLEVIEIDKIEPHETVNEFLSMTKNKSDGSYWLSFTRANGKKEFSGGGYYTNGGSLDRWVEFNVETDTVLVKFSGTGY